jgi:hypothetical protein
VARKKGRGKTKTKEHSNTYWERGPWVARKKERGKTKRKEHSNAYWERGPWVARKYYCALSPLPIFVFPCPLSHISILSLPIGVPGVFALALVTLRPRLILTSEPRRITIVHATCFLFYLFIVIFILFYFIFYFFHYL